jgi:hypothetical protein
LLHTAEERFGRQSFRAHVVKRGETPAKNVITASEKAGAFEDGQIARRLNDAEQGGIAPRVAAHSAQRAVSEVSAFRASVDSLGDGLERGGQIAGVFAIAADQVKR